MGMEIGRDGVGNRKTGNLFKKSQADFLCPPAKIRGKNSQKHSENKPGKQEFSDLLWGNCILFKFHLVHSGSKEQR